MRERKGWKIKIKWLRNPDYKIYYTMCNEKKKEKKKREEERTRESVNHEIIILQARPVFLSLLYLR